LDKDGHKVEDATFADVTKGSSIVYETNRYKVIDPTPFEVGYNNANIIGGGRKRKLVFETDVARKLVDETDNDMDTSYDEENTGINIASKIIRPTPPTSPIPPAPSAPSDTSVVDATTIATPASSVDDAATPATAAAAINSNTTVSINSSANLYASIRKDDDDDDDDADDDDDDDDDDPTTTKFTLDPL